MKISDMHSALAKRLDQYKRIRDFLEGADALRAHDLGCAGNPASAYIPCISEKQTSDEYTSYVRRALYYNAVARTQEGLLGLVFGKAPVMELGAAEPLLEDGDLQGTPLAELLEEVTEEVLTTARFGWLIDRPPVTPGASKLDEERDGIRPYIVPYRSEDIIMWSVARFGTRWKLSRVVLHETYDDADGKVQDRYRELLLDGEGYVVNVWEKWQTGATSEFVIIDTITPSMGAARIAEIPFYFFDPRGGRPDPGKPPLVDLVEVQRSHYQSSADLEHARFSCSLPTPYFIGFSEEEVGKLVLGGLNGIHSTNPEANVGFLEYTGQGVTPLREALSDKAEMMAKLGSRMLAEDKKQAETAEAMRIRSSGESATLADIARAIGRIATQALGFAARWMGGDDSAVEIELNTEYTDAVIAPQELTALFKAVQDGTLPARDLYARLRKVGIIEADRADEDIEAELEALEAKRADRAADELAATAAAIAAEKAKGAA